MASDGLAETINKVAESQIWVQLREVRVSRKHKSSADMQGFVES